MSEPRPIETSYRGYRFRSRLEARYAVFFEALGIPYDYEPQGYVVDGRPYLPDFSLPHLGCFAEVKPTTFTPEEFARARGLGTTVLLDGTPEARYYFCTARGGEGPADAGRLAMYDAYLQGDILHRVDLAQSVREGRLWFDCGESTTHGGRIPALDKAVTAARSARFEYGASGAQPPRDRRPPSPTPVSPEYALLRILCHHPQYVTEVQAQLTPDVFKDPDLRTIYTDLIARATRGEADGPSLFSALLAVVTNPRQTQLLTQIAMGSTLTHPSDIAAVIHASITQIRQRQPKAQRQQIIEQLRTVADGSVQQQYLLREYQRLSQY